MSIIKDIRLAIFTQEYAAERADDKCQHVCRVLVDFHTYAEIRLDRLYRDYCNEIYPAIDYDTNMVITILGKAIVPSYDVKGFELMLINGNVIKPAEKGTAQD